MISPEVASNVARLPEALRKKVLFVWYPDNGELRSRDEHVVELVAAAKALVTKSSCRWFDLRGDARWRAEFYRDGIHPNPAGNRALGQILAEVLDEKAPQGR